MIFLLGFLFLVVNLNAMELVNKKTMSKTEIVDAFNKNTNFMIVSHFEGIDAVTAQLKDDISFVHSTIPDETFNYVFENHFNNDSANARIKQVVEFYTQKNVPWTWWVSPGDMPENLEQKLSEAGLVKTEEYNGMYCYVSKRIIPPNLPNIQCMRVRDKSQLREFYRINASEHFDRVWSKMSAKIFDDSSPLEFYVGYLDQKPVTAGLVVFHADIAGIYSVATDEQERKKGYATALMSCLLDRIEKRGYTFAALSASDDVKNLYEKLGFQDMCVYRGWKKPINSFPL